MTDDAIPAATGEAAPILPTETVKPPTTERLAEEVRRDQARADRTTLMGWLAKLDSFYQRGYVLISRDVQKFSWEQAGFATVKGQFVVKFGTQPYQPIGRIDDEFFYPNDFSKLVWIRQFSLVLPAEHYQPAFEVKAGPTTIVDESLLTERDRTTLTRALKEVGEELVTLSAAIEVGDAKVIGDCEFRVRETCKLAGAYCQPVNRRMRKMASEHADLGTFDGEGVLVDFNYDKMDTMTLGRSITEYARMVLNEDGARRFVKDSVLTPAAGYSVADLVESLTTGFTALLPAEGQVIDVEELQRQLGNAQAVLPELRPLVATFDGSADFGAALAAILAKLAAIKAALTA